MNAKDQTLKAISGMSKVPEYDPAAVKRLMARLDLNERGFAILMNVTPFTIRMWTTGAAKPCGTSRRLMQIYENAPGVIRHITRIRDNAPC